MRTLVALLTACTLLAGCSGGGGAESEVPEEVFDNLELEVTATTGVIRGVVVDEAIRPVAGATVSLSVPGGEPLTAISLDTGAFGFDDLEPGTYFLTAAKDGFLAVQQSAEVVAGVAEPPVVKMVLVVDGSYVAPYVEAHVLEGFIECGVTTPAIAGAVCSFGEIAGLYNLTNDRFNQFIPVGAVPTFIQHELVWKATQNTGNMFNLAARTAGEDQFNEGSYEANIDGAIGVSPVVIPINASLIEEYEVGLNGTGLAPAVFAGGMEGTNACAPQDPGPLPQCVFATGATVEQSFTLYTHIFYGYAPPEGWLFVEAGSVPEP